MAQAASHFCPHCGAPNRAGATFCGRCGQPMVAAAYTGQPGTVSAATISPAAAYAPRIAHGAHVPAKPGSLRLWLIAGAAVVAVAVALGIAAYALRPQPSPCTGPQCTHPPTSKPLAAEGTYTSGALGFSVDFSKDFAPTSTSDSSVDWSGQLSDGTPFDYSFTGDNANGRSAEQVVQDVLQSKFPEAKAAYPAAGVPGAELGYTPGYGQVYDVFVNSGQSTHERVIIIAAVQGNVAVTMVGEGPWRQWTESLDDHPNPADVSFVHLGEYQVSVDSVRWRGEPSP